MKKLFKALKFSIVFTLFLSSFIACDKDFNVIESDVLGDGNANFTTNSETLTISAYNKKLEALQINNLASNLLGVFNDPAYGRTTASIVTQLTPSTFSPDFGDTPVIDSIVLNIPYFSTANGIDDDGNLTYKLDSLYGNTGAKFKITIHQNNYFLRDFDPNITENNTQNYFSNASSTSNSVLNGSSTINFDDHILGGSIFTDDEFIPSNAPTLITTGEGEDAVVTRSEPAFRVLLDNTFWQEAILSKQDDAVLSNANNFKNYFRGLYFKVEAVGDESSMVLLNLASSDASITINYTTGESTSRTQATYTLNFNGNRLNTFINDFSVSLEDGDKDLGDEKLYLKGSEGSMAVVDLFGTEDLDGNLIPDRLDTLLEEYRATNPDNGEFIIDSETGNYVLKRLINEAHLVIQEDLSIETGTYGEDFHIYDRIYAYDVKNNTTLIDYIDALDPTGNTQTPFFSKIFSLGQRSESGKYKIRITEHLNNIIQNDSTNYNIGLVLSTNVNYNVNSEILNSNDAVTGIPSASLLSPRGTILHGSAAPDDEDKLKLKIFFTEAE